MTRRIRLIAGLFVVFVLVAAACGDDGEDESTAEEPAAEEATADGPAAGAIQVAGVDLESGTALVLNTGDIAVDISGHWACNRPNYVELPAVELAPGEAIQVAIDGLAESGGEVAIYTSNDFGSSEAIISYVGWGSGGGRESVAEAGGVWSGPPVEAASDGLFLSGEPGSAEGWG